MKVDIITATMGRSTLHSCLAAVEQQNYPNVRHVVISDGPFQGDRELINWWLKRRGSDLVFHELKKPLRRAGNGAKEWWINHPDCSPIFRYLDDDDWIPPHSIYTQVIPLLEDSKVVMTICKMSAVTVTEDGIQLFKSFEVPGKMSEGRVGNGSVMVRTAAAKNIMYQERPCSDFYWLKEIAAKGKVVTIPLPLYWYNQSWRPWRGKHDADHY